MNQDRHQRHTPYGQQQQQYSFDHYDLPSGRSGLLEKVVGESLASKMRSPFFATAALLVTGAALAGIIVASYPSQDNGTGTIPVIQADTTAYKETPEDKGGMDIPNRDTTIFSAMGENAASEAPPVENLLDSDDSSQKLSDFARGAEQVPMTPAPAEMASAAPAVPPVQFQKIEKTPDPSAPATAAGVTPLAIPAPVAPAVEGADAAEAGKLPKIHKAGENPETLKFVRSVLENQEQAQAGQAENKTAQDIVAQETKTAFVSPEKTMPSAPVPAKVEPSSGTPVTAGNYYIQLGSVTSEGGAQTEWGKLKVAYGAQLQGLDYRVQKADIAGKGVFYRIQAGPISKESAASLCNAIKAQKPGGCLVTR